MTTMLHEIEYLDSRGVHYDFQPTGELYVQQPYNTPFWKLAPAKIGDVGMDFPVRIKGDWTEGIQPRILTSEENPHLDENDLRSSECTQDDTITIPGGGYASLPSAVHLKIPDDAWGAIRPRSSTGWKKRIQVFEGTIDSGYTGIIACLVFNPHPYDIIIKDGDRLAQIVLIPKYDLKKIVVTDTLPDTERGDTGFGSTG